MTKNQQLYIEKELGISFFNIFIKNDDIENYIKLYKKVKEIIIKIDEKKTLGQYYALGFAVIDDILYDTRDCMSRKYKNPTMIRLRKFTMQNQKKLNAL